MARKTLTESSPLMNGPLRWTNVNQSTAARPSNYPTEATSQLAPGAAGVNGATRAC